MQLTVFPTEASVAREAARAIAAEARYAVKEKGSFFLAVSGGRTPWIMLRELAKETVPWSKVSLFQVDERVAPVGDPDRNLTHIQENLANLVSLPPSQIYAMPVNAPDLEAAAKQYAATIKAVTGAPGAFDVVHLGLGSDGHTASLVPGDDVLNVTDADVAVTGTYQGRRRMTLTYPILNRTRRIVWIVTGTAKGEMLRRLLTGDTSIPAGQIQKDRAIVFADSDATDELAEDFADI